MPGRRLCLTTFFIRTPFICTAFIYTAFIYTAQVSGAPAQKTVASKNFDLPLAFERQAFDRRDGESGERYVARGQGYMISVDGGKASIGIFAGTKPTRSAGPATQVEPASMQPSAQLGASLISMEFAGGRHAPATAGPELPGRVNYIRGNDPRQWKMDLPTYQRVTYSDVYPGIDIVYYGNGQRLEFDMVLKAGADPRAIRMKFEGARKISVDPSGELLLETSSGEIRLALPQVFQNADAQETDAQVPGQDNKRSVKGRYVLRRGNEVSFEIDAYDRSRPLVIDPVIEYGAVLGGNSTNEGIAIAADTNGNIYLAGYTYSSDFPTTSGVVQPGLDAGGDGFITKINSAGTAIIYSTYLGGALFDYLDGIAVDSTGAAWVAGYSSSLDFPLMNPYQATFGGGSYDAVLAKLSPTGALQFSTYLGGSGGDYGYGVAVDAANNAYIAGYTQTPFPTTPGVVMGGGVSSSSYKGFVAKFTSTGSIVYSTLLGGNSFDAAYAVAADTSGNAYVTGYTDSSSFTGAPAGGARPTSGGGADTFITKLNSTGTALLYFTFLGGSSSDIGRSIAIDSNLNAYVGGYTTSTDLHPTAGVVQSTLNGEYNAFIAKLNAAGSAFSYVTYLGGSNEDIFNSLALESSTGDVYLTGYTDSPDFPLVSPVQTFPANSISLFQTTTSGASWSALDTNLHKTVYSISPDPVTAGVLVAATQGGIYRTTNGGASWTQQYAGFFGSNLSSLSRSPATPSTIYAMESGVSYLSTDDGVTWNLMGFVGTTTSAIVADPLNAATAYSYYQQAATSNNGLYITTNSGTTWTLVAGSGLPAPSSSFPYIYSMVVAPNDTLYVLLYQYGVYQSTNHGASWTALNTGLPNPIYPSPSQSLSVSFNGSTNILYLAYGTIYKYSGSSWAPTTGFIPNGGAGVVASEPGNPNVVYATSSQYPFVYLSSDGGTTWTAAGTGIGIAAVSQIAFNPLSSTGAFAVASVEYSTFVAKLNSTATALVYSTYLGSIGNINGNSYTYGYGIVSPGPGQAVVTGEAYGTFPVASSLPLGPNNYGAFAVAIADATPSCTYAVNPSTETILSSIQTLSFGVNAPSGCAWTAVSSQPWATVVSGASGTAAGVAIVQTAANTTGVVRFATITVNSASATISQAPSSCTYALSSSSLPLTDAGGSGQTNVIAGVGCPWTVINNDPSVLAVTSGSSGSGNGTVSVTVAPNFAFSSRSLSLTIGGQGFSVTEAGAGPSILSISPSTVVAGETFTLTVNGEHFQSGSSASVPYWNTAPNVGPLPNAQFGSASVLTATVPASFIQTPGSYPISVETPNGASSYFTTTLPLTVVAACSYVLNPPSAPTVAATAGSFTTALTTSCSYSTVSNSPWITITSGGSGSGSGTIGYSVSANTTGSQRTGSITVLDSAGDQAAVFTIMQQTPPCSSMSITSGSFTFGQAVANGAVTLSSGCPWSAVSSSTSFLTLPASTGTASSIAFNVTQNPGSQRSATITVTNTTTGSVFPAINVVQNGMVCTYSIADATSGATSNGFSSSAGSGSINVTAPAGCAWIATTPSGSFVSITGSASGSGNGSVSYSIPTSTAARSSSITITGQVTGQSYTGQVYTITQASPATTASCVANAGVPPTVRAEGVTERVGDIVITCATGSAPAPGIVGDVTVYFSSNGVNVAPSNQLIGSGSYTDALLLIGEPTAPVLNTNAFRGEVTPVPALAGRPAGYVMLFPAVQLTPTAGGSFSNLTFRITNMRLNVSAPGVSTVITATVSMPPPFASGSFTTQTVAFLSQGLPGENTPTSMGLASQTAANFTVNFAEGFANDFRPRLATGQNPSVPGTAYNSESGFVNSAALGTQTGFATTGTRLLATFTGVPAGVTLYAPVAPVAGSNAGLVAADATGNGGTFVPGSLVNGVLSQVVSITGGTGFATWEVTGSNPAQIETFGFNLYISNPGGANLSNMKYAISFAPAIGLGGTSATAPIPRFPTAGTQPALGNLNLAPTAGSLAGSLLAISHIGNAAAIQKALALAASSTMAASSTIGGSVTVSELVANASSNSASNVVVGGSLPTSWTVAGCYAPDANGSCTMSGNQFTVNYPTLSPGQTGTIIFTGQTPQTGLSTLSFNSIVSSDASNGSSLGSFTVTFPVPAFTIQKTHASNFTQGQTGAQYSISVVNSAATSTSGQVTVTDTLPTGLTLTGMSDGGAGVWGCTVGTATCTTSQSLAPTLGYPPITVTVTVSPTAPANVINTATVSGGGSQGPATALDSTNIGPACSYQLNAASAGAGAGASTGSVNVTALYGCQWTATSNASWLTVTSGSPGNGNGTVGYSVAANPGPGGRSGTLTIGGQTFTVNQTSPGPVTMSLSQTTLNFGVGAGTVTDPQFVTVSFSGGAAAAWTASSNQANVIVSPTSGTGLKTLQITASAGPGGTITVTAPSASNSPLAIQVNLATVTPGSPFGSFDTPSNGATGVSGSIAVTGWALDNIEVTGVNVMREPVAGEPASPPLILVGGATFVSGARPDVQALYPSTPFNYQAGWGYLLLTNELPNNGGAAGPGNGTYKLHAIATNKSGVSVDLGTKTITVNNAAATLPFGAIDTPGQGATVSGTVTNFGWALTPPTTGCPAADQPCIIPVNGSTIFVYVDGASLGSPVYNLARCDVDQLFPGYANSGSTNCALNGTSPGPVGYFNLDTTQLTNGVHTIAWCVTDNAGKAQGIGSRYFTVEN